MKRTTRARTPYRVGSYRRSKLEGGNYYHVTSLSIPTLTDEFVAPAVAFPIVSNSFWTDWQWRNVTQEDVPETDLEPIVISGGTFSFQCWTDGPRGDNNSLIFVPYSLGLYVTEEYDSVGQGNPADLLPATIPNYFLVDYGRRNPSASVALLPPATEESPWRRPHRTLFRHVGVLDKGGVNAAGAINNSEWFGGLDFVFCGTGWKQRVVGKIKRVVLKRNQALYGTLSGYYTETGVSPCVVGLQVHGRFGYRRIYTGAGAS